MKLTYVTGSVRLIFSQKAVENINGRMGKYKMHRFKSITQYLLMFCYKMNFFNPILPYYTLRVVANKTKSLVLNPFSET